MSDIPVAVSKTWQEARGVYPDCPVIIVWILHEGYYMRYLGEFYLIDNNSYFGVGYQQWRIAGIGFSYASIAWMIDNSIAFPFTSEDLVLYLLTWGDSHE